MTHTGVQAPGGFQRQDCESWAAELGDSFYVVDEAQLAAAVAGFRCAFGLRYPKLRLAYPHKTNHAPQICQWLDADGVYSDVASDLEYRRARAMGIAAERIIFNGPARSTESLRLALADGATVVIDSPRDLRALDQPPPADRRAGGILLRCSLPRAEGTPSRLGIDPHSPDFIEAVAAIRASHWELAGLHTHLPGYRPDDFALRTQRLVDVAERHFPQGPEVIDVGGGYYGGVPRIYPHGDPPTPADYAEAISGPLLSTYGVDGPLLVLEPGTALVARAVSFVTRVLTVRRVADRTVAGVAGSILHTSPNTRRVDFPVSVVADGPSSPGRFDVAGATPMEDEYLAFDVPGTVREGDFVVFSNTGAYSLSFAPEFICPVPPVMTIPG